MSMSAQRRYFLAIGLLAGCGAQAHVRQRVYVEGQESFIAWPEGKSVRLDMHAFTGMVGVSSTVTSLDFSAARTLAGESLAQWSGNGVTLFAGLTPSFQLDLDGGLPYSTSSACETTSTGDTDGVNNLVFTSKINTSCASSLVPVSGVIGLTKVAFRQSNGEIVEADIQFDDQEFLFKTTGSNNLSPGSGQPKEILLKDVMVHELGHFWGLDHSPVRQASMLFAIAEDLHTTKKDDQMGLFSLYPPTQLSNSAGEARGSLTLSSKPVFGAAVHFLQARTLEDVASEMTDLNGAFDFCALPPGPYVAYASSYRPYGSNIHEYYSGDGQGGTQSGNSCYNPGCELMTTQLEPSWYTQSSSVSGGLALRVLNVAAGKTSEFVNLTGSESSATIEAIPSNRVLTLDAPVLARLSETAIPLAGTTSSVGTHTYQFVSPSSGNVQIRSAALRIYGRLQLNLSLYDAAGTTELGSSLCPVSSGSGEAFDEPSVANPSTDIAYARDPWLNCSGLTAGSTYTLKVTGTGVSCDAIPGNKQTCKTAGESASSSDPLYVVTIFESSLLTDTTLGETLGETSQAGTEYSGLPACGVRSSSVSKGNTDKQDTKKKGACCGTLGGVPGGPSGPHSLLFSLLLSPLLWWALGWKLRRLRRA